MTTKNKQVVVGISDNGKPYVISKSRGVDVVFKPRKSPSLKKRIKTALYQVRTIIHQESR